MLLLKGTPMSVNFSSRRKPTPPRETGASDVALYRCPQLTCCLPAPATHHSKSPSESRTAALKRICAVSEHRNEPALPRAAACLLFVNIFFFLRCVSALVQSRVQLSDAHGLQSHVTVSLFLLGCDTTSCALHSSARETHHSALYTHSVLMFAGCFTLHSHGQREMFPFGISYVKVFRHQVQMYFLILIFGFGK
jgi:hypothetical protein